MGARIAFRCRHCGERNVFDADRAGKTVLCAHCGMTIEAPLPRSGTGPSSGPAPPKPPGTIKIGCGLCGHRQFVDAKLAGQVVVCAGCGKQVRVPRPAAIAAGSAAPSTPSASRPAAAAQQQPSRPPAQRVPAVEPVGPAGDDLYGLEEDAVALSPRGSMMPAPAAPETEVSETPKKKKKKKKKKGSGRGLEMSEILGTVAAIAGTIVVVGILAAVLPDARLPLGIVLAILGFIAMLIGNYGIKQAAMEAGTFQYLLCRFVPLYSILFILTHWDDTKDHLAIYCIGMSLLLPGVGLFGWSELHQKAAAHAQADEDDEGPPAAEIDADPDAN